MQQHIEGNRQVQPEGKEIVSHMPINHLFILVHPLNEPLGTVILANNQTGRVRKIFLRMRLPISHHTLLMMSLS